MVFRFCFVQKKKSFNAVVKVIFPDLTQNIILVYNILKFKSKLHLGNVKEIKYQICTKDLTKNFILHSEHIKIYIKITLRNVKEIKHHICTK